MRYVSVDIETLGTNPTYCDIIEFGAVIDDGKSPIDYLPFFHSYVLPPIRKGNNRYYRGEPFAMSMHAEKLARISKREEPFKYIGPENLPHHFKIFLVKNGFELDECGIVKAVVAGKNFYGFDMRFLRNIKGYGGFENSVQFHHRAHDPSELYFDPKADDVLPDLSQCLSRAGIDKTVEHSAVADALDVVRLLRHKWGIDF